MKNKILIAITFFLSLKGLSQTTITNPNDSRVITTGIPFALIAPDARSAGLGDMGVATSPDGYSQFWNASKNVFNTNKSAITLSYTP
ncbi:MAG: hypothetical protein WBF67_05665, partial [Olleya sp.]